MAYRPFDFSAFLLIEYGHLETLPYLPELIFLALIIQ